MYQGDFRQVRQGGYERVPHFSNQNNDRRPPRDFPGRSQSTQIMDRFSPREMPMRKAPSIPMVPKSELVGKQNQLILQSLPTDFVQDEDDPLAKITEIQSDISEKFLRTMKEGYESSLGGAEIIKKCPRLSKPCRASEQVASDLNVRYEFVKLVEDGLAANLDVIFD